jgi:hypothetical protein
MRPEATALSRLAGRARRRGAVGAVALALRRTAAPALVVAVVVLVAGTLLLRGDVDRASWSEARTAEVLTLAAAALAAGAGVALAARRGLAAAPSEAAALARVDGALGLRDRLSGAWALRGGSGFAALALEQADALAPRIDLARALPLRWPDARPTLLLVAATASLALVWRGPRPAGDDGVTAAVVDANAPRRALDAALALEAGARAVEERGLASEASRRAAAALRQAAGALRLGAREGTASRAVTLSKLARLAGAVGATPPGATDLAPAGEALARAPLGRELGAALAAADPEAIRTAAERLAGATPDAGRQEAAELQRAAADAAGAQRAEGGAPALAEALEAMARADDAAAAADAARRVGEEGAAAADAAAGGQVAAAARDAIAEAWSAADEASGSGGDADRPGDAGQAPGKRGKPRAGDAAEQGGGEAQLAEGPPRGGGRAAGGPAQGVPARGPSGSTPLPGTGASGPDGGGEAAGAAPVGAERVGLDGALGARGESLLMAIDDLEAGRAPARGTAFDEARRVEEAALRRAPLSPVERDLALRYLDLVRARAEEDGR